MTVPSTDAPLVGHLAGFIDALRRHGIIVGPSAHVDAACAVHVLDLLNRTSLREGLACTLLTEQSHRPTFDALFNLWFPAAYGRSTAMTELPTDSDGATDIEATRDMVVQALTDTDAESDQRLQQLVATIVDTIGRYESTRGEAFSSYEATSAMRPQTLIARIAAAMAAAAGDGDAGDQARYRRAARSRTDEFTHMISAETTRRMAEGSGRDRVADYAVPDLPDDIAFLSAGRTQMIALRATIDPLARLLAAKLATRARRVHRGRVDVRKTLRASMSTGGVPIDLSYAKPRPRKPELVIICDVSGSVAGFSQFTLTLVFALRQHFSGVRVFAFVDSVDEVTDIVNEHNGEINLAGAIHQIMTSSAVITRDGHSDYGHVLDGFVADHIDAVTHRGAVLILGDGRTNFHDPQVRALRTLVERARHTYWLNPESAQLWGTGDSAADDYERVVPMFECRTVRQLAAVVADLLPV